MFQAPEITFLCSFSEFSEGSLTCSQVTFFWTCHEDLLLAMVLVACSGSDVDKHSSGDCCTFSMISPLDFARVAGHSSMLSATGSIAHTDTAEE